MRRPRLAGGILAVVAAAFIVVSIVFYCRARAFVASAAHAQGAVIKLVQHSSSNGGPTFAPVVQFSDQQGAEHIFQSRSSSNPPAYQVGDAVGVLYSPGAPDDAKIDSFVSLWLVPLIFGFLGVTEGLIGLAILFWPAIGGHFSTRQSL